ncbi:MAG: hypothetical protein NC453_24830 [Muribaculum sp.]|nr:hypothetical protein [Muribaculum sp.]
MKRLYFILIAFFVLTTLSAQENGAISLGTFVENNAGNIPSESVTFLTNRMKKAVAANGYADNKTTGRFALVATCDVLSKDIAPTTPPKISIKLELSLFVVDLIDNKIFDSCDMVISGIGTNETKAYNTAFQKVQSQNANIGKLLSTAKDEILNYYTNSCPTILRQATTLAEMGEYDKAIFSLMSVPDICADCHIQCQKMASDVYHKKIDAQCSSLLEQAKAKWAAIPNASTASEIAGIIGQIDPRSSNYQDVEAFRKSISDKLSADAAREWAFQMQKYNDNQQFKMSIVDACRAVGVEFAKNFKIPQMNFFGRR